jgi:pilus assembly protein TadC
MRRLALAGLAGFAAAFTITAFLTGPVPAAFAGIAGAGLACAAAFAVPAAARKQETGAVERELPSALRNIAAMLDLGTPFEDALLASRLVPAARVAEKTFVGEPMSEALNELAKLSPQCAKAAAALGVAYDTGETMPLRKAAAEIAREQEAALREYSGKLAAYSVMFVVVSAVLPALFQALIVVGAAFLEMGVTPEQVIAINVLLFPLLDVMLLGFVWLKRPGFA